MTLSEFLLACITEDEVRARRVGTVEHPLPQDDYFRVMLDCDAKRRIVELHSGDADWRCQSGNFVEEPCETLRALALPYADHPNYDEAWRFVTRSRDS